ncbi:MAG: NAD+ synthase [Methanomicrobiales archaeon]|nr:NAD+ synthase [Methanomicrobiales archaeon]
MKIAIAQLNPVVGDTTGNVGRLEEALAACSRDMPDLVIFPELFLTGYPPRDLLEHAWFIRRADEAVRAVCDLSKRSPGTGILVGAPVATGKETGRGLYNAALLIRNGNIVFSAAKSLLPVYDVFDEGRYFDPAPAVQPVPFKDQVLGITICEDAWNDPDLWPRRYYPFDPQQALAAAGATLFVNIAASPFHIGKETVRFRIFQNHARKHGIPFVCVNQVGGNDELVFDGRSMCFDPEGKPVAVLPAFTEHIRTVEIAGPHRTPVPYRPVPKIESLYQALVCGLADYVRKCGFSRVVVGLSGGIDSAVVCCIAADAVGPGNVLAVTMPGPYSSAGSIDDSRALAAHLGVEMHEIPITPVFSAYSEALAGFCDPRGGGVTFENIQARIRGNILMALSNESGHLVLSTGNKSELAVGYCTLYGDMSGGLAVISDVLKTDVYRLAAHINRRSPVIPPEILEKPPSAELRPGQRDQDTLPPYDILDPILHCYIDEELDPAAICGRGFDPETVRRTVALVDRNEYKRRQAAPGLKVTPKAFGSGRRMPIAAKYRD